ncbi:Hydroxyethylthiazole kinase [Corynebacterium deserti GIMN1.010]|uniref:Hydroxyethylthiazole kinase n=1 Tax=Corynebacterium deserti GIMN1.010 TaxID=931089 RepID=A0A0M4CX75_9CORY|nr:hydroxyethylthiazole kinase [Corynebacterium deserti]ALC05825.1 Hydroxyethylthiazole kinase [Corynebacterium deserti GIMN1.010]
MADSYLDALNLVRQNTPLVQCLTNSVVMQFTANVLLAAGASPAMVDTPAESEAFAQVASGVLINAGTPSAEQYQGMRNAIDGANKAGTPWVLDPVAVGGLAERTLFVEGVVDKHPAAIRGNASEIVALAGLGAGGRGVDATDSVEGALTAGSLLAKRTGAVVAVSGAEDLIVSAGRVTWLRSGHPMLQQVIGTGCSLGALTAAYLGATKDLDRHDEVLAAHAHVGAAGQVAATKASSPGSFAVAFLDALYEVTADDIAQLVETREA